MSDKQVYQRLVGINTKIPIIYHDNPATEYQKEQLIKGSKAIANKSIKVISRSQTISSIRKRIIEENSWNIAYEVNIHTSEVSSTYSITSDTLQCSKVQS